MSQKFTDDTEGTISVESLKSSTAYLIYNIYKKAGVASGFHSN